MRVELCIVPAATRLVFYISAGGCSHSAAPHAAAGDQSKYREGRTRSAHHPFDIMAQESRAKKAATSDQEDRLSALPDGPLQHILGFLPAHEVVRTSVLAPRWHHIWKSVRRLHITSPVDWNEDEDKDEENDGALSITFQTSMTKPTLWVRYALLCQAEVLNVQITRGPNWITLGYPPLVSRNLRKLELTNVYVEGKFLDFANCPALEVLKMTDCDIGTQMIMSQSIKILHIESSYFQSNDNRILISVPSLIWLQLKTFRGTSPLLESMPSLETASVKPAFSVEDSCNKGDSGGYCSICAICRGDDDHKGRCVLLGGLSSAVNLELAAYSRMFLFRRDLNWCPTFSNLKKLLLNDWCVAVDLYALVCILKHSPVLENLTLQLCRMQRSQFTAEIGRKDSSMEKSAISERLKIVKIECKEVDDRVCKLLKFLSTLDIEFIFVRDLRWSPMFSNLKTLLLKEWCVACGLHALICLLEHSSILEKLTLQLSKGQKWTKESVGSTYKLPAISERLKIVEIKCANFDSSIFCSDEEKQCKDTTNREGNYHLEEQAPAVSEHLCLVKIICFNVDERVHKLLKLLCASDIQIDIQQSYKGSEYFSFEK
ncbi:hypothetical protein EJB05_28957, partial [Eragrostis curvula]